MKEHLYHYRAEVQSVYDGDTCTLDIDLGLGVWQRGEKIRLARINTPELRGEERPQGLLAADFVRDLLMPDGQLGKEIWISTEKDKKGKYGRYVAEIWLEVADGEIINLNDALVEAGHAEYKEY